MNDAKGYPEEPFHPWHYEIKHFELIFKLRSHEVTFVMPMDDHWGPQTEIDKDILWRIFCQTRDRFEQNLQPGEW